MINKFIVGPGQSFSCLGIDLREANVLLSTRNKLKCQLQGR